MSAPVHVLMLPSSTAASAAKSNAAHTELAHFMRENEGDYLSRRNQMLKPQRKVPHPEGSGKTANEPATFDALWSGSSPLEVAIATCCDHEGESSGEGAEETDSSSPMVESGSSDTSAEGNKNAGGQEKEKKSPSGMDRCGAIGRGNEGKFAALIARHCHTAGDRALALAVLQRTMERDEMVSKQQRGKKRKRSEVEPMTKPPPPAMRVKSEEPSENSEDSKPKAEDTISMDTDEGADDFHRMANFLSAGGLKVLNQWLIDAFTPVPATASAAQSKEKGKRRKPQKDQDGTVGTTTSPTGPILLPLLSILQSIPFNMELVRSTQINKQIKKLKKNLDRLVANFDEEESESDSESSSSEDDDGEPKGKKNKRSLEALTHPVSGGMSVVQVQKDVEKLMQTWKVAASDKSEKGGDLAAGDFYGELRAKMEEQFLALSQYESGEAEKPLWLEKLDPSPAELKAPPQASSAASLAGAQKAAAAAKKRQEEQLKRQSEASKRLQQQQAELKAAQAARLEAREKMEQYRKRMMQRDGSMLKKRKAEVSVDSQDGPADKKPASTRRVTWADQKTAGAKLVEVREFVRETDVYQSEDEEKRGQDSDDESDEKFEEDDFDDGDYDDETQASDSVDSDDFDGILNEEDANFSQEEEAGFTFETQELSKGTGGKGIQLNDDLKETDKDGWETFRYDM